MQLTMPRLIAAAVAILVVTGGAIGLAVFRTSNAVVSPPSPAAPRASAPSLPRRHRRAGRGRVRGPEHLPRRDAPGLHEPRQRWSGRMAPARRSGAAERGQARGRRGRRPGHAGVVAGRVPDRVRRALGRVDRSVDGRLRRERRHERCDLQGHLHVHRLPRLVAGRHADRVHRDGHPAGRRAPDGGAAASS